MPYLKTRRGLEWFFDREGEGQAIIFLHGWGVDRRIWRQQFKFFSASYRVLAFDLPGHGATRWQPLGLSEIAEDIAEILMEEKISVWHLVASSFGGLVGLALVNQIPGKIKTMTLVGSQPKFVRSEDYPYGLQPERIEKLAGQLASDYPAMVHIFFRSLFTRAERESRRYKWIQTFRRADDVPAREALLGLLAVLTKADLRSILFSAEFPVLFANGTEDPICPAALYVEMQKRLPRATLAWFPDSGHFPFLIHPHEFNRVLAAHLETPEGASGKDDHSAR